MKLFLFCGSILFSSIASADIAPEEPASEPANERDDSGESDDEKSDDTGCSSVSHNDISVLFLPVLCLGAAIMLRKESDISGE